MIHDSFSSAIACINGATKGKSAATFVPNTNLIQQMLSILVKLNFIYTYSVVNPYKIRVLLKYLYGFSAITSLKRVSIPSRRTYVTVKSLNTFAKINNIDNVYQIAVLSTSKGLLTHHVARQTNIGGELLFLVR